MLPKLDVPIHELKLVSTGKTIRFRPFLVKEQKLFLMASESEDPKETIKVIRQVIKNCVLDEIDIDSLPSFDLELLFMHLRARSVQEIVDLKYKCNNIVKDEESKDVKCTGSVDFKLNILEIETVKNPNHTNKIELTENLGICLKYPTFEMLANLKSKNENETLMELLTICVDNIFDQDNIYYTKDVTREELVDFIDNLQQKDLEKIQEFFETAPKIKKNIGFSCRKCGYKENIEVEGLQNFFI